MTDEKIYNQNKKRNGGKGKGRADLIRVKGKLHLNVNIIYILSKYVAKSLSSTWNATIIGVRPLASHMVRLAPAATSI